MPNTYDRLELRISQDRVIADAGPMGSAEEKLVIPFDDPDFQKDLEALRYQFHRPTIQETMAEKQRLDAVIQARGRWATWAKPGRTKGNMNGLWPATCSLSRSVARFKILG